MSESIETVCVVGLGYIGLPTAATLAASGIAVKGTDIAPHIVEELNAGKAHFVEPDLDMLVRSAVESGRLTAYLEPQPADAFIITVPTPIRDDKSPDMSFVENATRAVAKVANSGDLIILESTSPLGATRNVARIIAEERPDLIDRDVLNLSLAYCPERILPGQMVRELVENDRIVGGFGPGDAQRARSLYARFVRGAILETDAMTAELVKLIENAYRDINIAFANEVANVAEAHGLDPWEAITLANHHPRVNILNPGPGVGGHCIAVDPWFLISQNRDLTGLMAEARRVNDGRPDGAVDRIKSAAKRAGSKTVACLGLAFKPNVDDLRGSPALEITARLADQGFDILAVEPNVETLPEKLSSLPNVRQAELDEALDTAPVIAVLVAHREFSECTVPEGKCIIDTVGLWRGTK